MKRKLWLSIILVLVAGICLFTATACKKEKEDESSSTGDKNHVHVFREIEVPISDTEGYYLYECDCGYSYKGDSYTKADVCKHTAYSEWESLGNGTHVKYCKTCGKSVTENCYGGTATCKDRAVCSVCHEPCGDLGDHNLVKNPSSDYLFKEATCEEPAVYHYSCSVCGNYFDDTFEYGKSLGHEFTDYISDNNATYESDGTKTARCNHKGCNKTDTITDKGSQLVKHDIAFKTLSVNGTSVNTTVANSLSSYDFSEEIEIIGEASYSVSKSLSDAGVEYPNVGSLALSEGDNVFYVKLLAEGKVQKTYTVTIRRRPIYIVSFDANGGTSVDSQSVEEGEYATPPVSERLGYTLSGWNYDFTKPITENRTITANWSPNVNTKYVIEYYFENIDDDGYTKNETVEKQGTTDTVATAEIKDYEHFIRNENLGKVSGNIAPDGTLVLSVYYTREVYTVTFDGNGGTLVSGESVQTVKYGGKPIEPIFENNGYIISGYFANGHNYYIDTDVVTESLVIKPLWQSIFIFYNNGVVSGIIDEAKQLTEIIIPTEIEGITVTAIGSSAFSGCTNLQNITLPDTVTSIGYNAFEGCSSLKSITIPDSITTVGGGAFNDCTGLEEIYFNANITEDYDSYTCVFGNVGQSDKGINVVFGNSVSNIPAYLFNGCSNIRQLTIPESVTTIGQRAFKDCIGLEEIYFNATLSNEFSGNYEMFYNAGSSGNGLRLTVGSDVTKIPSYLFYNYGKTKLVEVVFEEGTKCQTIGEQAFYGCSQLKTVNLPNSITTIGLGAFGDCAELESITIPNGVTEIPYGVFSGCGLKTVVLPNTLTTIGNRAFSWCTNLTEITIPNGVTKIGSYLFWGCKSLVKVVIPNGVTEIGEYAFNSCTSLASITIPDSLTSVGEYAFCDCYGVEEIILNANLTTIGYSALGSVGKNGNGISVSIGTNVTDLPSSLFSGVQKIVEVVFEEGSKCTEIVERAFYNCSNLKTVKLPNSLVTIGDSAFASCSQLATVKLPNSLVTIGDSAFESCSQLANVNIPENVTSIGSGAFSGCKGFTNVTIPKNVTSIGSSAFSVCSNLEEIYFNAKNTEAGSWVFAYAGKDGNGITVIIGKEVTQIPDFLFNSDSSLPVKITDVVFEEGSQCRTIGRYAFANITELLSVTIPDSVAEIGEKAFYSCTGLVNITLSSAIAEIGSNAFYSCTGLETVKVNDISAWCDIKFADIYATPMYYADNLYFNGKLVTDLVIPDGITTLNDYAFYGFSNVESITIPDSLTIIGTSAFTGTPIKRATMPSSAISRVSKDCLETVVITSGEEIGKEAFKGCTTLKSITLPDTLKSIGSGAFSDCTSLESIVIPEGVSKIDSLTFNNCISLATVVIPNSVTYIYRDSGGYWNAFKGAGVTNVTLPINLVSMIFDDLRSVKTMVITEGESVKSELFKNYTALESITLPESLTSIGNSAFYGCTGLKEIILPESLTTIEGSAFSGCTGLEEITLSENLTSIGSSAFKDCTELEKIYVNDLTSWCNVDFADVYATPLYYAKNLYVGDSPIPADLVIPNDVTAIKNYAFYGLTNLESVTIPDSVTSIGEAVFSGCSSLKEITIPFVGKSAETSDDVYGNPLGYIFGSTEYAGGIATKQYYRSNFGTTTFYIPESLKKVTVTGDVIPRYAFYNCSGLKEITVTDRLSSIDDSAIENCSGLTGINLPESLTSIGSYAFRGCTSLKGIVLPESLISIGYAAFSGCTGFTEITIPKNVTSIENHAFSYCTNLTEINFKATACNDVEYYNTWHSAFSSAGQNGSGVTFTVGKNVTKIPANICRTESYYAKDYAPNIVEIVFENDSVCENIGKKAFDNCIFLKSVKIPDSVTEIGECAFYDCDALSSVTIGEGVTTIGKQAFANCWKLSAIYFKAVKCADFTTESEVFANAGYYSDELTLTIGKNVTKIPAYMTYTYYKEYKSDGTYYRTIDYNAYLSKLLFEDGSICESIGEHAFHLYSPANNNRIRSVTLPNTLTSIGSYAFYGCTGLEDITLSNSLTTIDSCAFSGCSRLKDIIFPESLTTIASYAFSGCNGLTNVIIPDTVTTIGSSAFKSCNNLLSVTIGKTTASIGDSAFYNCRKLVEVINKSETLDITKGSSDNGSVAYYALNVKTAGASKIDNVNDYLFFATASATYLLGYVGDDTDLVLPDDYNGTKYTIYKYAFYYCNNLTSVTIGDSVTSIGDYAFNGCDGLESVTFGSSVSDIGDSAFVWCNKLTDLYYTGTIYDWLQIKFKESYSNPLSYAQNLYLGGELITELVIPETVTSIGANAFYGYDGLTSVTIPETVTSIGENAFSGCTGLTSITIPEDVTSIGEYAFYGCTGLTTVNWNAIACSAFSWWRRVFDRCTVLTTVNFGENVTKIPAYAFYGCTALTNITIPENVTSIGDYAFYGCTGLTTVNWNATACETIGSSEYSSEYPIFKGCTSLTTVNFGEKVTKIPACAFYGCSSVKIVKLSEDLTSIGYRAFYGCRGITSITLPEKVTSIGSEAFYGCYSLVEVCNKSSLTITAGDKGNTYVGYYALAVYTDDYETKLSTDTDGYIVYTNENDKILVGYIGTATELVIPSDITKINKYALYFCTEIISITTPEGVTSIGDFAFCGCSSLITITISKTVTSIGESAFSNCSKLTAVYYTGTETEWLSVSIGNYNNYYLTSDTLYYYSETEPALNESETGYDGNYWHYDENGDIAVWEVV